MASPATLGDSQARGAADLEAMTRLQKIGALFLQEGNLAAVLAQIVEAAIAVTGADFGNIQILAPAASSLRIVAQRGFPKWWLDFWDGVGEGRGACGTALERGERVAVEDVEHSPLFAGTIRPAARSRRAPVGPKQRPQSAMMVACPAA